MLIGSQEAGERTIDTGNAQSRNLKIIYLCLNMLRLFINIYQNILM
jgi:hypothetical protein